MLTRFILYGLLGWCVEVFWSAIEESWLRGKRDWRLKGQSYLWSFPLYGHGRFPVRAVARRGAQPAVGGAWNDHVACIWLVEYAAGWTLRRSLGVCPWDYTTCRHHLRGLISWDYLPIWFVFGLILEYAHDKFVALTPHIVTVFGL